MGRYIYMYVIVVVFVVKMNYELKYPTLSFSSLNPCVSPSRASTSVMKEVCRSQIITQCRHKFPKR